MRLYLLIRNESCDYDESQGFVIRAETEAKARQVAESRAREGGRWLNEDEVTCEELEHDGPAGIVCHDYHAG